MAKKQLYRTVIQIEVLSENPISDGMSWVTIARECNEGTFSGMPKWKIINEPIVGKKAAERVVKHGSDYEFFNMDENGNDLDEDFWYFVSIWEDGTEIKTEASFDEETGYIEAEISDDESDHGFLVQEYIVNQDGDEKQVCPECHCYVLKTVMKDGIGLTLHEIQVCSNPDCDNN